MNCRRFEHQAADWLGDRLPAEQARRMAAHREACVACAQVAQAEAQMRRHWRAASGSCPPGDVWPQIAPRLEAQQGRSAWVVGVPRSPRWVFSGAALLAVVTVFVCGVRPLGTMHVYPRSGPVGVARLGDGEVALPPVGPVTLSALADVGQVNPAVDDPVGTSMEDVWSHIKTSSKVNGR